MHAVMKHSCIKDEALRHLILGLHDDVRIEKLFVRGSEELQLENRLMLALDERLWWNGSAS